MTRSIGGRSAIWHAGSTSRRPDAMTQIDVFAFVQESGIGQDAQPAEPDQCGGITDEVKIAFAGFCRPAGGQLQGSHSVVSSLVSGDSLPSITPPGRALMAQFPVFGQIARTGDDHHGQDCVRNVCAASAGIRRRRVCRSRWP